MACNGREAIWIVDAHGYGKRFVVRSDEKLTAFVELESLVAEQVEKVNPDLVTRDAEGKLYTVRYDAINAMLLNEFLKEHNTVQHQQQEIDALKTELKQQAAQIQKVSVQLELSKSAPQTALNSQ